MAYQRQYSRLAKIEERRSRKSATLYIFLSIVFIGFLAFFGFKLLGAITGIIANVNSDESIDATTDLTPPSPPRLNSLSTHTNKTNITVSGTAEPQSAVTIHINSETKVASTDDSGNFSTNVDLFKGENSLYATAKDLAGNESNSTSIYTIAYDDQPPKVEIIKPTDGSSFSGASQKQLTVEGTTEADARITINDRVAIVDSSGKFKFPTTLGNGENSFNIKSTDKAGNQTELTIHVNFSE